MLLKAVITAFPRVSLPFLAVPLLSQPTVANRDANLLTGLAVVANVLLLFGGFCLYMWYDSEDTTTVTTDTARRDLSTGGIGEVGHQALTHEWQTVKLEERYSYPVILAGMGAVRLQQGGGGGGAEEEPATAVDQATVRIKDVQYGCQDGASRYEGWCFDMKLQEPACLRQDGVDPEEGDPEHPAETVSWLALETGSYHLDNGLLLQAGHVEAAGSMFEVVMTTPFDAGQEVRQRSCLYRQ
eukprot:SAG22_NODE_789_length_7224_cov_2.663953_6_plen_241_part_00